MSRDDNLFNPLVSIGIGACQAPTIQTVTSLFLAGALSEGYDARDLRVWLDEIGSWTTVRQ
jgi:hypothetical protein